MSMTDRSRADSQNPSAAARNNRAARVVAGLAVAAPVLLASAVFIHPEDTSDAAESLTRIADERARWVVAHVAESLAWLLLAFVMILVIQLGRATRRKTVLVGASLAATGGAASALIVYSHGEAYFAMTEPEMNRPAMEQLYSHLFDAVPLVGPLAMLFSVGLIVLAIGLFRSGAVPRWAAVALVVTPVALIAFSEAAPAVSAIAVGVPLVAGMAGCARAIGVAAVRGAS